MLTVIILAIFIVGLLIGKVLQRQDNNNINQLLHQRERSQSQESDQSIESNSSSIFDNKDLTNERINNSEHRNSNDLISTPSAKVNSNVVEDQKKCLSPL